MASGVLNAEKLHVPLAPESDEDADAAPSDGRFASLRRQLSDPEDTRLAGSYSLPVGAPDLVGDRESVLSGPAADTVLLGHGLEQCISRSLRRESGNLHLSMSPRMQLALVTAFLCVDSSRYVLGTWALQGNGHAFVVAQVFVMTQGLVSFASALIISVVWQGTRGLKAAADPCEALRWLPVSIGFALGQASIWHAFGNGLGAATAVAVGYLYMPLSAVISRWLFRRSYGWLEAHALVLMTLSILAFTELRSRAMSLSESVVGFQYALLSVAFACLASLMAEWVLKPKYSSRGTDASPYFCVQKVRNEVWGSMTSAIVLMAMGCDLPTLFKYWDGKLVVALIAGVLQGWLAGLVAKHLSTVAKAVIQCLSSLIVFFCGDLVVSHRPVSSTPIALLALVVALTALMYQIGRGNTLAQQSVRAPREPGPSAETDPEASHGMAVDEAVPGGASAAFVPDAQALAPREFHAGREERLASRCPQCPRLDPFDHGWLARARAYNGSLAEWAASRAGLISQLVCVVAFIVADAGRTLVYEWALSDTAIVQQSLVVLMSAASIVVGVAFAAILDGKSGVKAALDLREAVRYFPVSACFSLGTTCTIFAYGIGISAVQVTVIGYAYIPLSALLSRWIFKRAYKFLEWLSLVLMVLSVCAFVLLQDSGSKSKLSVFGVAFVLVAVALSCLGSILAEKIMKAGRRPFHVQNTSLQIGSLLTAVVMLFVDGALSTRPNDAFWRPRDVGGGDLESGIFVGWGPKAVAALVASTVQSWLAGLVAKRLSTVTRAVAQCVELVIIYFLGDLVLKGKAFDWPVGSMALAVALTVQVFAQAGRKPDSNAEAATCSQPPVSRSAASSAVCGTSTTDSCTVEASQGAGLAVGSTLSTAVDGLPEASRS